jgi:hypothetical protein
MLGKVFLELSRYDGTETDRRRDRDESADGEPQQRRLERVRAALRAWRKE